MKDLFGQAILDYQTDNDPQDLLTETSISEADDMSVAYLFRSFVHMPAMERKALEIARGKVLDIGCGAGSHSLYLQEKGFAVFPIDISANAVKACQLRGLGTARVADFMDLKNEQYDTILLLMNGIGICGRLAKIDAFLSQLKSLLRPGGQILVDSSDILYMFDQDEDGGKWIPGDTDYYGEVTFTVSYKGETSEPFDWLYLDRERFRQAANRNGLEFECIAEGSHHDYLACLGIKD